MLKNIGIEVQEHGYTYLVFSKKGFRSYGYLVQLRCYFNVLHHISDTLD